MEDACKTMFRIGVNPSVGHAGKASCFSRSVAWSCGRPPHTLYGVILAPRNTRWPTDHRTQRPVSTPRRRRRPSSVWTPNSAGLISCGELTRLSAHRHRASTRSRNPRRAPLARDREQSYVASDSATSLKKTYGPTIHVPSKNRRFATTYSQVYRSADPARLVATLPLRGFVRPRFKHKQ